MEEEVEPEKFNINTIHQYKKNLGCLGDIYVNDAPLASLTNSNSVNEIKCPQKIMGMKMTEELRNISQFFLKKFPLDINSIYYEQPDPSLEYFTYKSTAIIGGICKNNTEILEKILLANSFLDTFTKIFLVGEMALAALHALGFYTGNIERLPNTKEDYDKLKEFFIQLFETSVDKNCEIILPCDFVTCKHDSLQQVLDNQTNEPPPKQEPVNPDESGANISQPAQPSFSSNFKPTHWTDAKLYYNQTEIIDMEGQINKSFRAATSSS